MRFLSSLMTEVGARSSNRLWRILYAVLGVAAVAVSSGGGVQSGLDEGPGKGWS